MRIANRVTRTRCEGPGERYALWFAGCSIRCPGCCNPELFDAQGGELTRVEGIVDAVAQVHAQKQLEGVSVLGGEPFDQGAALVELMSSLRQHLPTLGLIIFSGYSYASLSARPELSRLWSLVDTLIDGPFEATQREAAIGGRRYIGSTNQGLVHFSARYRDPELWSGPAQAEVQVDKRGRLSVHGEPELTRRLQLALARPG